MIKQYKISVPKSALNNIYKQVRNYPWKDIQKLAHPEKYGGKIEDAFDVIVPSLPGFGFSGLPSKPCLLYTSPSPRDLSTSRMPSSA